MPPTEKTSEYASLKEHVDERFTMLSKQMNERHIELFNLIKSGFPEGDIEAHRRVHEGYIKDAEEKASLWRAVREKTISGAVWAALMMLAAAIWGYIKGEVTK